MKPRSKKLLSLRGAKTKRYLSDQYPKKYRNTSPAADLLRLNTLRGAKTAFLTSKKYDVQPPFFLLGQEGFSSIVFQESGRHRMRCFLTGSTWCDFSYPFTSASSYNPGQNFWDISIQFSISRHGTIVSKRNKFAPLPNPGAMLFRLSSSSVHFLCYRKQHCNRGRGKQSFNLRQ